MTITDTTTIADIATALPSSVAVFQRHDIDFCCGGKRAIADVCRDRGLDLEALAGEIDAAAASRPAADRDWSREALGSLIDHIVETYHDALREELPRLDSMGAKVAAVHGSKDAQLTRVAAIVTELRDDLLLHMQKEELVLFPAIEAYEAGSGSPLRLDAPIGVMEHEHDRAGALIDELRQRTAGYAAPEWACATLRALYHGLRELEAAMHLHVHLENNVLFPRARRLADPRIGA